MRQGARMKGKENTRGRIHCKALIRFYHDLTDVQNQTNRHTEHERDKEATSGKAL